MKRSFAWIVASFALTLAACTAQAQPRTALDPRRTTGIDFAKACPGTRWIAALRASTKSCPAPPSGVRLQVCRLSDAACRERIANDPGAKYDPNRPKGAAAATGSDAGRANPTSKAPGLDRFCLYEGPDPVSRADLKRLVGEVESLDPDCKSAAALGSDLETMTWQPLQTQFLQQTGRASIAPKAGGRAVRLAIVDTQPTSEGVPTKRGCSPHGYTLAHMAQNLVCSDPAAGVEGCAAQIATRLALKVKSSNPGVARVYEPCEGGLVGWIADLAAAIQDEVDSWTAQKSADHLILNLSVGWDADLFGGLKERSVEKMQAPVQAVYRALEYATERGALVIAAAGNATPGPTAHEGPILPAGWEGWSPGSTGRSKPNYRPLVFAVGGVRWNDALLSNSRPKANPPRVAYADHAVVADPNLAGPGGIRPTATLTGTSVAALVVSSSAALAWGEKPTLAPNELMQYLETSRGFATQIAADFGTPAGGRAKRICLGDPSSCKGAKSRFSFTPSLASFPAPAMDASVLALAPSNAPCRAARVLKTPGTPIPNGLCPCDQIESANAQPWVEPQPESDPCTSCAILPARPPSGSFSIFSLPLAGAAAMDSAAAEVEWPTLFVDIPDSWWAGTSSLMATTLEVAYSDGEKPALTTYSYALNQTFNRGGATSLRVTGLPLPPFPNAQIRSATLNFRIERNGQKMSVMSPLFFSP